MNAKNNIKMHTNHISKAYSGMKDDHGFLAKYANFLLEEGKRSEAVEVVKQLVTLFPMMSIGELF